MRGSRRQEGSSSERGTEKEEKPRQEGGLTPSEESWRNSVESISLKGERPDISTVSHLIL